MVLGTAYDPSPPPLEPGYYVAFQRFSYTGMRFPHIEALQPQNGDLVVTVGDTCGASCCIETASSLRQGDWNEVTEIPSFSDYCNVVLPNTGGSVGFVRFRSK
jgi:hypothetical protein